MQVGPGETLSISGYVEPERCLSWLDRARGDAASWQTYFDFIESYGRAWYLDIEAGTINNYFAGAAETNARLASLDGLIKALTASSQYLLGPDGETGLPCRPRHQNLGPYWAEAGLVVMTAGHEGQMHADYEGLAPYPAMLFDGRTRAYSAVLSLFKPDSGGHLKVWSKHRLGHEKPEAEDYTVQIMDYAPGTLSLFDSFCYHQILSSRMTDDKPYRAIAAMHFLYLEKPYPHWEFWF